MYVTLFLILLQGRTRETDGLEVIPIRVHYLVLTNNVKSMLFLFLSAENYISKMSIFHRYNNVVAVFENLHQSFSEFLFNLLNFVLNYTF